MKVAMTGLKHFLAATLLLAAGFAWAQSVPPGDATRGKTIYVKVGCYECHGYQGQGSNAGSRLAPNPAPFAGFAYQLRQPRTRMPAYAPSVMSDQDIADIYAYLQTIPPARSVDEIPILAGARPADP